MIDTSNLTQLFIPICIKDQMVLENITKKALQNSWNEFRKPELVALLYIALGNARKLGKLYLSTGDSARAEFFKKDFTWMDIFKLCHFTLFSDSQLFQLQRNCLNSI